MKKKFILNSTHLSILMALIPTIVYANNIVPTYNSATTIAPCSQNCTTAPTEINIAGPDGRGISYNTYERFDVFNRGVVFNNRGQTVNQQTTGQADIIINQITSPNRTASILAGHITVDGKTADIIIANPNGITCQSCSFGNTDKVILAGGIYNQFDDKINTESFINGINGQLANARIEFHGIVNLEKIKNVAAIGRAIHNYANVTADNIQLIAGRNIVHIDHYNKKYNYVADVANPRVSYTNYIDSPTTSAINRTVYNAPMQTISANRLEIVSTSTNSSVFNQGNFCVDNLVIGTNSIFYNYGSIMTEHIYLYVNTVSRIRNSFISARYGNIYGATTLRSSDGTRFEAVDFGNRWGTLVRDTHASELVLQLPI